MSRHASIVSVNGTPWLHFWPVILSFDFTTYLDPDPAPKIPGSVYQCGSESATLQKDKEQKRRCQNGFFCFSDLPIQRKGYWQLMYGTWHVLIRSFRDVYPGFGPEFFHPGSRAKRQRIPVPQQRI
jgi:hypothetical protein